MCQLGCTVGGGKGKAMKYILSVLVDGTVPEPMSAAFRDLSVSATFFAGREVYAQNPAQASP